MIPVNILERLARIAILIAALMMVFAAMRVQILGSDVINHFYWIRSFPELVLQGDLRPTWLPGAYGGLGSPTFYFYTPLTYWIATPFYPLLSGLSDARYYSVLALFASVLSFFSFRYYCREKGIAGSLALWAPLLYAVAPFRVYEIFTRSGLSAQFAVAIIPLVFLAIDGLIGGKNRGRYFAVLSVSIALLMLCNIPTCVMTLTVVAVYLVILIAQRSRNVPHVIMALFTGALIAAFYLVPIQLLTKYVQRGHLEMNSGVLTDAIVAFRNIFSLWEVTESAHAIINVMTALLAIPLVLFVYRRRNDIARSTALLILSCLVLVVFLQIGWFSKPVWSIELVRTLIQFPHRWSVVLIFAIAILYALLRDGSARRWVVTAVLVWGVASAGFSAIVALDLRVNKRPPIKTPFDPPEYATIYSPKEMNTVIAIAQEHAADPEIQSLRPLNNGEQVREVYRQHDMMRYEAQLAEATPVIFQQWRWPFWKLYAQDGSEMSVSSDTTGRMTAVLPAGATRYELRLVESDAEKLGKWLSLLGLVIAGSYAMILKRKDKIADRSNRSL